MQPKDFMYFGAWYANLKTKGGSSVKPCIAALKEGRQPTTTEWLAAVEGFLQLGIQLEPCRRDLYEETQQCLHHAMQQLTGAANGCVNQT